MIGYLFHVQIEARDAGGSSSSSAGERAKPHPHFGASDLCGRRRDRRAAAAGGASTAPACSDARRGRGRDAAGGQVRAAADRPQRPLLVRLGQEVQALPRRLSARREPSARRDPARPAVSGARHRDSGVTDDPQAAGRSTRIWPLAAQTGAPSQPGPVPDTSFSRHTAGAMSPEHGQDEHGRPGHARCQAP